MKSPDMNLETSVSANGDGAGVRWTEPTAFNDGAAQTAAGAGDLGMCQRF